MKHAVEWNSTPLAITVYAKKAKRVNRLCEEAGRDPKSLQRSMMSFGLVAADQKMLDRVTAFHMGRATGSPAAALAWELLIELSWTVSILIAVTVSIRE